MRQVMVAPPRAFFRRRAALGKWLWAVCSFVGLGAGPADEPPKPEAPPHLPRNVQIARRAWAGLRRLEAVEMVLAILKGSQMGPDGGWFHPGQSRYTPLWLAAHYDANHDLRLTRKEFSGPSALFDRLDRDHDGTVTAEDFDWTGSSAFLRQTALGSRLFSMVDASSNGKVSREEWEALFERMAGRKAYVTPDDLKRALFPPVKREDGPPPDAPTKLTLLKGLLSGELGSLFEGPAIDQPAPAFALKTQDGKRTIALADYKGKMPVVLVFGSFT